MKGSKHKKRIEKISKIYGRLPEEVEDIVSLYYESMSIKVKSIKIDDTKVYTEEEFNATFKSILIPRIGSLMPSYPRYINAKKKLHEKTKT